MTYKWGIIDEIMIPSMNKGMGGKMADYTMEDLASFVRERTIDPKIKGVSIRLNIKTHEYLKALAKKKGTRLSRLFIDAVAQYIRNELQNSEEN